jgi:hypothetical protein
MSLISAGFISLDSTFKGIISIDSAKQTSRQLLNSFAIKGGNFSLSYGGKFADLQFLDWLTNKICNLQINQKKFVESHILEICGFEL